MAEILALRIEGIQSVQDETKKATAAASHSTTGHHEKDSIRESVQFLFATDQTLRSGVHASDADGHLILQGEVSSLAQKNWAEQLSEAAGADVQSRLKISETAAKHPVAEPPAIDDESQEALVLFRLRLVRETEHLPLRVKAHRGVVTIQGKVRTEALRQRVENIARSTLGLRELRSTLSISA